MRYRIWYLALVLISGTVFAADTDQKENHLAVKHYAGVIELRDGAGDVTDAKRLQADLRYDLRRTDSVRVSVEETNPLLFTYSWKDEPATDTNDFTAAKKFAESVKALAELFGGIVPEKKQSTLSDKDLNLCANVNANTAPDDARLCSAGVTPALVVALQKRLEDLHIRAAEVPQLVKKSAASWPDALEVRKKAVTEWSNHEELVKAIRGYLKVVREGNRKIWSELRVPPVQLASTTISVDPYAMPLLAAQQNPTGTGENLPTPKSNTDTANKSESKADEKVEVRVASQPLMRAFQLVLNDADAAATDIEVLTEFMTRARKIGEPVPLKTVSYNAKQQQPAVLTIKAIPVEGVDTSKYQTGDFKLLFRPGGPVTYDYGASAAYSFLEAPQFSAKKGDDDKLHIVRTDNGDEVSGTTGVAFLTVTPRGWDDPQFATGFQLGISPVKDKIGLFLGSRIRVYDLFTFGAGLAFQQTKRLGEGVALNDIVEAADKIKTNNVFKAAPYLSIGLEWPKK